MSTQSNTVYPGLLCEGTEFFKDGQTDRFFYNGSVRSFNELPSYYIELVREEIERRPDAKDELTRMHPNSEMKRVQQFIHCNFSGLDFTPDIKGGVLQQGEYWDCPLRGICPGEGKICKQLTYQEQIITAVEIKMIKLSVTDMTNEVIAESLRLPLETFNLIKKRLYKRLSINTQQDLRLIAVATNII